MTNQKEVEEVGHMHFVVQTVAPDPWMLERGQDFGVGVGRGLCVVGDFDMETCEQILGEVAEVLMSTFVVGNGLDMEV